MSHVTSTQIAEIVGLKNANEIPLRLRNNGVVPVAFTQPERGRRAALYNLNDVLAVYGINQIATETRERKSRNDAGKVRGKNPLLVELVVRYAFEYFLAGALPDVLNACERAVRRLRDEFESGSLPLSVEQSEVISITSEWLYKGRIKRKDSGTKCKQKFVGEFWSQGWEQLHLRRWKQHTVALTSAHVRYDLPEIFENAGLAGKGFGANKCLMLDDRTADSWSKNEDGEDMFLAAGVYVWDVLTGALLWVERTTTISAQTYIRAIICTAYIHGLADNPVFFLENAKASTAARLQGALKSLYTQDELDAIYSGKCEIRKRLGHGSRTIAIHNIPHIPRHIGKASGERRFGIIKREFDAQYNPLTYQGANRDEAVQLHVNNQHWVLVANPNRPSFKLDKSFIPTRDEYFDALMLWAYSEYVDRVRLSLKSWARKREQNPTIKAMIEYYSGETRKPTPEQLSYLLYFAQVKLTRVKCLNSGHLRATINGRALNLVSLEIQHFHVGRKIAVVPVPNSTNEFLLFLADDPENPSFIAVAVDMTVRTLADAPVARATVMHVREAIKQRENEIISQTNTPLKTLKQIPLPSAPDFMGELSENGNVREVEDTIAEVVDSVETISNDDPAIQFMSAETRAALGL